MFLLLITNTVKNLWDSWNIRAVVLLSLALQVLLILLAPIRKRTTQRLWILFIWVSYLLADWAASFAVGHISSSSKDSNNPCNREDFVTSVGHYFSNSKKPKSLVAVMISRETHSPAKLLTFWHFGLPSFWYTWVDQTL